MPFLLPILGAIGLGGWLVSSPPTPVQSPQDVKNINLTTAFGYLVVGGLVFYFGKKIIK